MTRPYELDTIPTSRQVPIMVRVAGGDRILLSKGGRGFAWERRGARVPESSVTSLLRYQWLHQPGYPLFDGSLAGTLTDRGQHALDRYLHPSLNEGTP